MTDRKILNISSIALFAALFIALIIPFGESGRIVAAILLLPAAVLIYTFIKKRSILSINKKQVLIIMGAAALVYIMLYYLTALKFGYYRNPYRLSFVNFFKYVLPISAIIFSSEIIRFVFVAQNNRLAHVFSYLSLVIADVLITSNIPSITTFNRFMNAVSGGLFIALVSNLLYNYVSKRYGVYPNLAYRFITTLHAYIIPIVPGISEALVHLFGILLPLAIYVFIDALFEKRKKYALQNTSRFWRIFSRVLTVIIVILVILTVMLVSNQFYYGALVIATDSMTGELNRGDVAFFERYEDQLIIEGQVIVFEKYDSMIVHRVAKIEIINGQRRYYTKGDANDAFDAGYITDADIRGLVDYKLPYFGMPTLWVRSLFA